MVTSFNVLLLFSFPAGVESVDNSIVLGKLDIEWGYIGGKQLVLWTGMQKLNRLNVYQ